MGIGVSGILLIKNGFQIRKFLRWKMPSYVLTLRPLRNDMIDFDIFLILTVNSCTYALVSYILILVLLS